MKSRLTMLVLIYSDTKVAIDPETQANEISRLLDRIAESAIQNNYWLDPTGRPNGQFEEDLCGLFDDLLFSEYVKECALDLSPYERAKAIAFERRLSSFLDSIPDVVSDLSFTRSARWKSLAKEAGEVAELIQGKLR